MNKKFDELTKSMAQSVTRLAAPKKFGVGFAGLALVGLLALPNATQAQFTYETNNGTITITGYAGPGGDVTIPAVINDLPVTSIGSLAFSGLTSLTKITIPDSVTNIGSYVFQLCTSLPNITIPRSVTSIGEGAFNLCTSLTAITVDALNSVYSSVDGVLFDQSQTTLIQCPWGKSGSYAMPAGVTSIRDYALSSCTSLSSVTIPYSMTNIGNSAFSGCTSLSSVTINNSFTSIGDFAFDHCTSLTNFTFGNGVTSIGSYAFQSCAGLTSVMLPGSVVSIGEGAFNWCTALAEIVVDPLNTGYSSSDGVLLNGSRTTVLFCPWGKTGSYTIPNSATSISDFAFQACFNLRSVTIPHSMTNIGTGAFYNCSSLNSVVLSNSVTSIGDSAFSGCNDLTNVMFGNGVTSIGSYAFQSCYSLTSVLLPNSVTNIAASAFNWCSALAEIVVDPLNTVYSSADGVLLNGSRTTVLLCPWGKAGGYVIPNSVTNIADSAFAYCDRLTSVTIPDSVISIGNGGFNQCMSLNTVSIGNGVTRIGELAFSNCQSLTNLTIGNSLVSIGDGAFQHCTGLTSITLPSSVASIGWGAFNNCPFLIAVYFLGDAPNLANSAFGGTGATIYYLPGTSGWASTWDGRPTALWSLPYPLILNSNPSFGVQTNGFGFIISWATNIPVVVEACTNLAGPLWSPVGTNTLTDGSSYFSDPQWTNYRARFYRLRSP